MDTNLTHIIERFAGLRVLVVGDVMLDSYLEGEAGRICREAPVPVVDVRARSDAPGGAANTAANVAALGGAVALLAVAGDDHEGGTLRALLHEAGVATDDLLCEPGRVTLAKHRVVAGSQLLVRFDQGGAQPLAGAIEDEVIDRLRAHFAASDALIVSDYSYGVLTPHVIDALADLQRHNPRVLVVDARDLEAYRHVGLTAVKPNRAEASKLLAGVACDNIDEVAAHGEQLLDRLGTHIAAVTLDTDGALVFERGREPYRTYAQPMQQTRAAGAGDTFVSALALALAAGAPTPAAAELAQAAATVVVASDGTCRCGADELREQIAGNPRYQPDLRRLLVRLEAARRQGKRVVFTNGCFDILHRSHIDYLSRARLLGDLLVVAVNGDGSVRRLRGAGHPINPLDDRLEVLSALSCIDHLVTFEEETPDELIRAIRPEIFVKGGDYSRDELPEAALVEALGGEVVILPYLEEQPTLRLIQRIRSASPAVELAREVGG